MNKHAQSGAKLNYITPHGFRHLQEEFRKLKQERTQVVDVVAWAASNGDRSENADYQYGKKRLREIDRRLSFLSKRIESAEVIDPTTIVSDRIVFGATVRLLDEDENERTYAIVGADESDPSEGRISWLSPLAKALLKSKQGEYVSFESPQGEREFEVLEVRYQEIVW